MGSSGNFSWGGDRRSKSFLDTRAQQEKDKRRLKKREYDAKKKEESTPIEYSDVDKRFTRVNDKDLKQMTNRRGAGFFQTSNSFDINAALRRAVNEGRSEEDVFKEEFSNGNTFGSATWQEQLETVRAMDRNMRPADREFTMTRMASKPWLASLCRQAGIPESSGNELIRSLRNGDFDTAQQILDNSIKPNVIGGTFRENAFASHSIDLSANVFTSRDIQIVNSVSKGTNVLFSPTKMESEVVLSRFAESNITNMYIARRRWDNSGQLVIEVRSKNQ